MTTIINQQLSSSSHVFQLGSDYYKLNLHWDADISLDARQKLFDSTVKFIKETLRRNPGLKPEQIHRIVQGGIKGHDERLIAQTAETTQRFWNGAAKILEKGRVPVAIPDVYKADAQEPSIHHPGIGRADFENVNESHYLDGIPYPRIAQRPDESEADFIRRCTRNYVKAAGKAYDPKKEKVCDALQGVALSLPKRSNYRMKIGLEGTMQAFFDRDGFTSTEVLAKNGIAEGAIAASANVYSDHVNLLRSIESEDGSVDSIAGRVQDLKMAEELAQFAFLSQMNLYQNADTQDLAQGIVKKGDEYEFTFAAQSLLPMLYGEETRMVHKEIAAYRQLEESTRKRPLEIKDPADPSKTYKVRFRPLPVSTVQFNAATRAEELFPEVISGELEAREQADLSDEAIFALAQSKLAGPETKEKKWISDSVYFLKNKTQLKPWQEIMVRVFLLHLLKIPLVVHCKSCVDRTNVVNALSTAIKQSLRAGKKIPQIDGKSAIFELPKIAIPASLDGSGAVFPFKELFAFNLHKGLKVTEWARGEKGYKYHRGFKQTPAFADLLPERYLKTNESRWKKWLICFVPVLILLPFAWAASIGALALRILTSPRKSLMSPLKTVKRVFEVVFMPAKFLWNAGHLFPKKTIDEGYELVGPRQFLEKAKD